MDFSFKKLIEALNVTDLTGYSHSLLVHRPLDVVVTYCVVWVFLAYKGMIGEQEERYHHQTGPALSCFAMQSDHCVLLNLPIKLIQSILLVML